MRRTWLLFAVFYDGEGGGAGAPAAGQPAAGQPTPSPTPASGAPAGAAPGAAGTPGQPAAPARPEPDRSTWIPPYRYNEVANRNRQLENNLQQLTSRVRALMGVAEPPNPRHLELRAALAEVVPELKPLLDKPGMLEKVMAAVENGTLDQMGEASSSHWKQHAYRMTSSAIDVFAEMTGRKAADLKTPPNIARFAREFEAFCGENPDLVQRYELGDPSLVREFVQGLVGFYVEPARQPAQNANVQQVRRARALPHAGPRTGVAGSADPNAARDGQTGRFKSKKERFEAMRQALLASQPDAQ